MGEYHDKVRLLLHYVQGAGRSSRRARSWTFLWSHFTDYSGTLVLFRETIRLPDRFDPNYSDRPADIASLERNMNPTNFQGVLSSYNRCVRPPRQPRLAYFAIPSNILISKCLYNPSEKISGISM